MPDRKTALQKAVDYLARREHSQHELHQKLIAREYSEAEIQQALQRLQEKDLQSDERFARSYVSSRYDRGHGPYKIIMELKQRGVDESMLTAIVYDEQYDWFEKALLAYQKKYGNREIDDYSDRVKRARFLQQRGFSSEQIQFAMETGVAGSGGY